MTPEERFIKSIGSAFQEFADDVCDKIEEIEMEPTSKKKVIEVVRKAIIGGKNELHQERD